MAASMGPPQPAGYSLRVQLFSPTAYDASDKPIRNFRVVASPEFTVEEFCVEASRIHKINYGTYLTLKKVQDDQQFDITQSEILGNLFATAATIRFVQASTIPGREDSVAPDSALRFDQSASRKREREGSARVNGSSPANAWKSNKRQRVAGPDEPLPSRESEEETRESTKTNGRISDSNVIPNSQESIILGNPNGPFLNSRNVRKTRSSISRAVREIAETPPPSQPPPAFLRFPLDEYGPADQHMNQHDFNDDSTNAQSQRHHSSPLRDSTARAQSQSSNPRAKSVQRATEHGTTISTAATSPLSVDQHSTQNGSASTSQRRRPDSRSGERERSGKPVSHDETSIYENIESDDGEYGMASVSKGRKASLRARNSPAGLSGMEWSSKNKFNTPPSGSRRTSAPRDQTTPGELLLTPNSREREARKKERQEAEEARKTRLAAAEARQNEETCKAEAKRAALEEQERIEVEDFKRGEAESKAAAARSARLEKEREAREQQEAEEERLREEARIAKEQADEEECVEEERIAQENATANEAERQRKEGEEAAAAALRQKKKTRTPEELRHGKSSSPILPKARSATPPSTSSRVQSSTPFIPGQRKSALKRTASSRAMRSSSPAGSKASTDDSSGMEIQAPISKVHNRRVSFRDEPEENTTPIRPPSRILPPKFGTPKAVPTVTTPNPSPNISSPGISTPKPSDLQSKAGIAPGSLPKSTQNAILPPPRLNAPILPPRRSVGRSSLGRSITPMQSKVTPVRKEPTPEVTKKVSPVATSAGRKSTTPVPAPKEKSRSREPEPEQHADVEVSSDDSEEDIPSQPRRPSPKKQQLGLRQSEESTAAIPTTEEVPSEDEDDVEPAKEIDEDGTQSHNSSTRDSRSPVVFSQHPRSNDMVKAHQSTVPEAESGSDSEGDDEGEEDQVDEDSEMEDEALSTPRNKFFDDEALEGSSSSGSEDDDGDAEEHEEEEDAEVEVPNSSPPVLPPQKHQASPRPKGINSSKDSLSDESHNTQDEIDQQLTSDVYEAHSNIPESSAIVYPPTSSAAPRPRMKVGVSLSSLNMSKSMLAASSAIKPVVSRSGQRSLQAMDDDNEESEEESNDDSDSASEIEAPPKPTQKTKSPARRNDSSDSDSDGNSGSDSESEDEEAKIRNDLAREIEQAGQNNENLDMPSPKMYKPTQQQQSSKARKKKAEKNTDKFLTGYRFNTSF